MSIMSPRLVLACTTSLVACTLLVASVAHGQGAELPLPSPHAKLSQRVGLTDFDLAYSSPGVKNRKVWGELVPYDKPWRLGANEATRLTASKDFTFGTTTVKAGTYALYAVPGKASWTIKLGGNPDVWGTEVGEEKVVAELSVKPTALAAPRERMVFIFSDTSDDGANLDLEWEKVRVRIPLKVGTKEQVQTAVGNVWRQYNMSARWTLESGGDLTQALSWVDQSIAIKPTWNNHWVKAQILAKKGQKAEARTAAEKAQELGASDDNFQKYFKDDVAKTVASWK